MTNTIKLEKSNFIKYLLYYFAIMLASNYIKTNYLVNHLVLDGVNTALFSAHLSSIVSSIFIIILIIIIILISIFVKDIFFEEINSHSIFTAIKSVLITFIIVEFLRIFVIYFILFDEIKSIDINGNIEQQLFNTNWYDYNSIIYAFLIIFGSILFAIEIYFKEHKIIPSIVFGLIFIGCFYLINVNIFDFQ